MSEKMTSQKKLGEIKLVPYNEPLEISIYMGTTLGLHNNQDLSRIPQKYHKKFRLSQTIYTPYAYL